MRLNGLLALCAGLMLCGCSPDPDAMVADAVSRVAEIEVKIKLNDLAVEFRDVAYRPVDPSGKVSQAEYVCGMYRQQGGGRWQRFAWFKLNRDGASDILLGAQVGADDLIRKVCPS